MAIRLESEHMDAIRVSLDRTIALDRYWEGLIVGLVLSKAHFSGKMVSADDIATITGGMSDDTVRRRLNRLRDRGLIQLRRGKRGFVFAATPEAAEKTLVELLNNGWDYRNLRP